MIPHAPVGIPRARPFDAPRFESAVSELLEAAGFAIDAQHLGNTAARVRELWEKRLLNGYDVDVAQAIGTGFPDQRTDPVILRGIAIHGMCPHHLVPFRGVAHVSYIPGGKLHGFGRVARLASALAKRSGCTWLLRARNAVSSASVVTAKLCGSPSTAKWPTPRGSGCSALHAAHLGDVTASTSALHFQHRVMNRHFSSRDGPARRASQMEKLSPQLQPFLLLGLLKRHPACSPVAHSSCVPPR